MSLLDSLVGFDPDKVNESIKKVEDSYSKLEHAIKVDMQTKFVDEMAKYWACNQAINYFTNNLKPAVDTLIDSSRETFKSVVDSMQSAARRWGEITNTPFPITTHSTIDMHMLGVKNYIDVSRIKENINGERGVDEENATSTISVLTAINENASAALTSAQNAVQDCGFVGREQAQTLINSLGVIKTNINNVVQELTDNIKTVMNETVSSYGQLAQNVESHFDFSDRNMRFY